MIMEFYSAIGKKHIEKTIVADFSIPNKHYYQSIDLHRSPPLPLLLLRSFTQTYLICQW